jgi:hypothetical protein
MKVKKKYTFKKQKGGLAEINVKLERRKYYTPFMSECLKGSSGIQIEDINKNFIFEYDDDTLKEIKEDTPSRRKLMNLLNRLSARLSFDFKLVISESSQCNPNDWSNELPATEERPRIIFFVSCLSANNVKRNNFGMPTTKKGEYIFTKEHLNEEPRGGVFKHVYYFGFENQVHLHLGDIYVCEEKYSGEIPKLTCTSQDKREECCTAKKEHFRSMFIEGLKIRNCIKLTEDKLYTKLIELKSLLDKPYSRLEKIKMLFQLQLEKFFTLNDGPNCQEENECEIENPFKEADSRSIAFNRKIPRNPIPKELIDAYYTAYETNVGIDEAIAAIASAIDEGADPNTVYNDEPLIMRLFYRNDATKDEPLFKMLIQKDASINPRDWVFYIGDRDYTRMIKTFYTLRPELNRIKYKVEPFFLERNDYTEYSLSPLEIAIVRENTDLVLFFLEQGVKLPEKKEFREDANNVFQIFNEMNERILLSKLIAHSNLPTIKLLFKYGFIPNDDDIIELSKKYENKESLIYCLEQNSRLINDSLIFALKRSRNKVSAYFGKDIELYYNLYNTILISVSLDEIKEGVDEFLKHGGTLKGKYGLNPLSVAKRNKDPEIIQYIEEKLKNEYHREKENKNRAATKIQALARGVSVRSTKKGGRCRNKAISTRRGRVLFQ